MSPVDRVIATYNTKKTRGIFGKLPLPRTDEQFIKLTTMPVHRSDYIADLSGYYINATMSMLDIPTVNDNNTPTAIITGCTILHTSLVHRSVFKSHLGDKNDDKIRKTIISISRFITVLGRSPTYPEWEDYYFELGLNSSPKRGHRRTRFNDCLKYVEKYHDRNKLHAEYLVGDYLDDIKQRITPEEIQQIVKDTHYSSQGRNRTICYEDIDICAGYHYLRANDLNADEKRILDCPSKGLIAWFQSLKEMGISKRSCNKNKIKPLRAILIKIGYAEIINGNYYHHNNNDKRYSYSQKWGLNINHPRYQEWLEKIGIDKINELKRT